MRLAVGEKPVVAEPAPAEAIGRLAEVKARGDGEGFKTLERWLGTHDALFLWRDRAAPLVVVPLHVWLELIGRGLPAPQVKS